jgi:protein TonB
MLRAADLDQTIAATVSSVDRFGFTLFLAVAVHALIILGLTFTVDPPEPAAKTLEVTLAQFRSEEAPDEADFIAQHNQIGSGDQQAKTLPTSRELAPFQNNDASPVAPGTAPSPIELIQPPQPVVAEQPLTPEKPAEQLQQADHPEQLVTRNEALRQVINRAEQQPAEATPPVTGLSSSLLARSLEIASLEAKLDDMRQERAHEPRVRRLTSASTRESYDALYLESWRRKVERVGNLNYPEEARRRKLFGSLRLLVTLRPDGSLQRVELLKSSGYKLLDDAAKRIVRMAAPYPVFPPELRKQADLVEIIRTWKFERSRVGVNS